MKYWVKISLLLSVFGFLKEFRPSEPFLFEFLTGPWKNLTVEELNQEVFPIGTYSYLCQLVIVFLITDLCRYKPLIILLGFSGIVIWSLLLWTSSLFAMQIVEVFYGLANALEVAYYTYIYAKVSKDHYPQVTSHTRSSTLIGRFLAGVIAQIGISCKIMDYRDLNYLSLTALSLATIWAIMLPSVPKSIYFHHQLEDGTSQKNSYGHAFRLLWEHFLTSYSKWHVLKWSIWWSLATCGYIQVGVYMQALWGGIVGDEHQQYNGGVEAVVTLLGAVGSLTAGALKVNWSEGGELALGICSIIEGGALFAATLTKSIEVSYLGYIVFGFVFQFMITVASSEVAKKLEDDCYGLIFGLNTLLALVLQTVLTLIVVSKSGFAMIAHNQYLVYGTLHVICGFVFISIGIGTWFLNYKRKKRTPQ